MNDKTEPDLTGTYPVPGNALEHAATYKERLGHAQVGDRVRILSGKLPKMGRLGLVTDVDHDDEKFIFAVRTDDGNANWCYDVERVATPTEHTMNNQTGTYPVPEAYRDRFATAEARLGHAQVGDRVRVLSGRGTLVGRVGFVTRVDPTDTEGTFSVEADDGSALREEEWCYDVERVAIPTAPAIPTGLDAYKALVRKVALRIAAEQGWCDEGLAAAMDELGITITDTYRMTVRFYGHQDVTVDVEAFDEDRARDAAFEDAREARNEAEWTYRDDDKSEVRSFRLMS